MQEGPTFSCPACGNRYPWSEKLAGRKGKCKCGAIMNIPPRAPGTVIHRPAAAPMAHRPLVAAGTPRPMPRPMPVGYGPGDDEDAREASAVGTSPSASSFGASAPEVAATEAEHAASADATVPAEAKPKRQLQWLRAGKWALVALFLFGWMAAELNKPTNPKLPGPYVGFRSLIVYVNRAMGLRAGGVLLALLTLSMLGVAVYTLFSKPRHTTSSAS